MIEVGTEMYQPPPKTTISIKDQKSVIKNDLLSLKPREKLVEIIFVTSNEAIRMNHIYDRGWYRNEPNLRQKRPSPYNIKRVFKK